MATWGKKEIKVTDYDDSDILYYEYSTTVDSFNFILTGLDEYDRLPFKSEYRFGLDISKAIMEAMIEHIMNYDYMSKDEFIEKYIENNRFNKIERI